jgi:hypothetical protein
MGHLHLDIDVVPSLHCGPDIPAAVLHRRKMLTRRPEVVGQAQTRFVPVMLDLKAIGSEPDFVKGEV